MLLLTAKFIQNTTSVAYMPNAFLLLLTVKFYQNTTTQPFNPGLFKLLLTVKFNQNTTILLSAWRLLSLLLTVKFNQNTTENCYPPAIHMVTKNSCLENNHLLHQNNTNVQKFRYLPYFRRRSVNASIMSSLSFTPLSAANIFTFF